MKISRTKKISIALLAIALLISSLSLTPAAAAAFTDITAAKYDWARPYIEKMNLLGIVKGMSDTSYGPDNSVTREQLITMLVRLMGWESEAAGKSIPSTFAKASSVAPWARGYVAVAVEKGIISGDDLKDFRPADAATRSEIAVFAVRALGLESEAKNRTNLTVSLSFTDGYLIEPEVKPYIEIAVEKGIMQGYPDKSFKPNDKVTRAQVAAVLNNMIKAGNITSSIVKGTVEEVDTTLLPSVEVKLSTGATKTYTINTYSTVIYKEDEDGALSKASLADIKEGNTVSIIANGNTASYIEIAYSDEEPGSTSGTTTGTATIEGIIRGINTSTKVLTIENDDTEKYESYPIASDAKIIRDGETTDIYKLVIGDTATVTITDGKVTKINAESATKEVTGTITDIDFSTKNPTITIEDDNGREHDYEVDEDAVIRKNSKSADISDLKTNDEVELTLEYDVVVKIVAESTEQDVSGTVKAVTFTDSKDTITVVDEDGKEHVITITRDTEIIKDRERIDATEIRPNYYVDVEVENNEAVRIDVTVKNVKETLTGTVVNVNEDVKVIVVSVKNSDGTKSNQHVYYTSDTIFYKDNREVRISKILVGDEVICIGDYDNGLFFADTIHDLTISD
ncbi:MAG TPA: S-layer homology domain-containing protein [Tepidanaerobacter syntrophicus]|uniref:S-layer homology domain-containing protein n=1 Tax=Tepidanaerobacter syntrophicus TaxID=224999 RepID=UPI0017620F24|nr:S-layer homology domain-containing protein [Tepidanaerobacter syntrophicus]HHV82665.1 S-layer homology domain-containing protein [Tepidanaerobacter syntrophicus]